MAFSQILLLSVGLITPVSEDGDLINRIHRALELRKELLTHYSVDVSIRTITEGPAGKLRFDSREKHYVGDPNEFRRDVLSSKLNGRSVNSSGSPRGRRGGGLQGLFGRRFQRFDLLAAEGLLNKAEVVGPAELESGSAVELRLRPKISGLHVEEGRLWVDEETGMPLQIQLQFTLGRFISDARLTLRLQWGPDKTITIPMNQEIKLSVGGLGSAGGSGRDLGGGVRGGGGFGRNPGLRGGLARAIGPTEISATWKNYEWDLSYETDFFSAEARRGARRRQPRGERSTLEDDPFEEIRITPQGAPAENTRGASEGPEEVLIRGASVLNASRSSRRGGQLLRLLIGGGGGRGGLRAARIAGGRANRLQGSITAGFSSSGLDAKPYSLNGQETPEPGYFTWNSGVSIGGPLPGLNSSSPQGLSFGRRRRASFFVDFNASRGDRFQSEYASVPTLAERQGDFSQTVYRSGPLAGQPVRISDPVTGSTFPNATVPGGRMNAAALKLLEFIPQPNRDDPFLNHFSQQTLNNTRNRLNIRMVLPLFGSQRLSGTYNLNGSSSEGFNIFPGLGSRRTGRGQNVTLSLSQTARPGLTNTVRLRWNRNRNETLNPFANRRNIGAELGIENTSPSPIDYGLPTLQFTNFSSLRDGSSSFNVRESNTLADNLQWVKAGHFFRIGGEVTWRRRNTLSNPEGAGALTFAGVATSSYRNGQPIPGTGYDLADFLLGLSQSSRIQFGNSDHYLRSREFALYVNDNWQLHSRLTLQWGLRYQFVPPQVERYDRLANLDVGPDFSRVETVIPGSTGPFFGAFPRSLIKSDRNNLAPRIALAYRVRSGRWASVLRANYGVFFPGESYDSIARELISQPPFGFSVQETVEGQDFLPIQTAFSSDLLEDVPNTYGVDPRFRLPTVQNWNLSWQQSLPHSLYLSVGYAGSRGTGLELLRAPNRITDGTLLIDNTAQFLYLTPGAASTFHGLQLLAIRRMRSGFTISGQYEFGKSLDNASSIAGGGRTVAQNDDDLDSERGRSRFDERHRFRLRWFFELPFGSRHRWFRNSGWINSILSNWFITGDFRGSSGRPFTARVLGNQINNSGSASQASERASVTGASTALPASQRTTQTWFNTNAFSLPEPGRFGNAGRNTIDGPGSWSVNLTLARSIILKNDNRRLLVTARATNLLNHANYRGLNTVVNSRGFGQVTSVGQMRRIEINLRFLF